MKFDDVRPRIAGILAKLYEQCEWVCGLHKGTDPRRERACQKAFDIVKADDLHVLRPFEDARSCTAYVMGRDDATLKEEGRFLLDRLDLREVAYHDCAELSWSLMDRLKVAVPKCSLSLIRSRYFAHVLVKIDIKESWGKSSYIIDPFAGKLGERSIYPLCQLKREIRRLAEKGLIEREPEHVLKRLDAESCRTVVGQRRLSEDWMAAICTRGGAIFVPSYLDCGAYDICTTFGPGEFVCKIPSVSKGFAGTFFEDVERRMSGCRDFFQRTFGR